MFSLKDINMKTQTLAFALTLVMGLATVAHAEKTYTGHMSQKYHQKIEDFKNKVPDRNYDSKSAYDKAMNCLKSDKKNNYNYDRNIRSMRRYFDLHRYDMEFTYRMKKEYQEHAEVMMLLKKADSNFDGMISGTELHELCKS